MNADQRTRLRELEDELRVIAKFHFVPYAPQMLQDLKAEVADLDFNAEVQDVIDKYESKLERIYRESHRGK